MKKRIWALILAALLALTTASSALAAGENGLGIACGKGAAGSHNPNCGAGG